MLQMVKNSLFTAILLLLLSGCDKVDLKGLIMPTGDVVDERFEQSFEMHSGEPYSLLNVDEAYSLYVCTDPHVSDEGKNIRAFATQLRNDKDISFGIVLGDCIDKRGAMPAYLDAIAFAPEEQQYNKPIYSIIGNHDLYFSAWNDFMELIGPSVYSFEVDHTSGKDIFIALDSGSGTHGSKQLEWLRDFLAANRDNYRHCIVMTHTNLFYTDKSQNSSGNLPMDETMMLMDLFSRHRVTICLQGHDHFREDLTFGGVRYTIVGTIRDEFEKPEFLCIRLSDDGVEYEWKYIN